MSHPRVPAAERRVTRGDAFETALQWFLDGRRLDMRALAGHLDVARSTLYRWFIGREALLGDIAWRIMGDTIARIEASEPAGADPRTHFLRVYGRLTETVRDYPPLVTFVADDPDYALRVLTSGYGTVQGHLIEWVGGQVDAMPGIRSDVATDDLAYAIVRLGESFIWSDMITGSAPRADVAVAMIGLLLAGASEKVTATEEKS